MKISFILPCYNVEGYVRKCIDSIVAMNYDEIEIIAINDGSKDNTLKVLYDIQKDVDIQIINFEHASGYAGRPRNAGIDAASGEYLAFIDPDDYYIGNGIIDSYECYKGYDIIVNSFRMISPEGKITDTIKLKDKEVNRCKFLWKQIVNVCNQRSLYKRTFIQKYNVRFYEDCRSQDLLFLYKCYVLGAKIRTTSIFTTMYLDERVDSVSNVISDRYIESSILAYDRFYKIIKNDLPSKEVESAVGEHFLGYYLKVRNQMNDKQKELLFSSNVYKFIKSEIVNK